MTDITNISVAYGDGIGPEIMGATLKILTEAGAKLNIDTVEIGARAHKHGFKSGIPDSCWNIIRKNKILLKAPLTTPQGGGYKSVNVTLRRTLGLYANVRPCVSYAPFVDTKHPNLDLVVIRENEEGLYAGIEHRLTQNAYQCLKILTRGGCERISKFAFDYAVKNNRKKVTCLSKDNIMKMTDGLFHKVFDEAAACYKNIENEHYIIDIGTARLANEPENFDVAVTGNLYGDIISDIVSEISGSVGLAGSANIGDEFAMFEAVHGSAPDIAGQNIANPSGLLNGAVMMLVHIGQINIAEKIQNAWLKTIEDGVHTGDIYNQDLSSQKVGTDEFANAVIKRLGQKPAKLKAANYSSGGQDSNIEVKFNRERQEKTLIGVDVFFNWEEGNSDEFAAKLGQITKNTSLKLQMLDNRGLKVWPKSEGASAIVSDFWRARFLPEGIEKKSSHNDIIEVLSALTGENLDYVKTENLYMYANDIGFTLAQGE